MAANAYAGPSITPMYANMDYNPENQRKYDQIMRGYQDTLSAYNQQTGQINAGYQQMFDNYANVGQSERMAMERAYAKQLGQSQQSLMSRGLGTSTVLDSARRGINYDLATSRIDLADRLAQGRNAIYGQALNYQQAAQQGAANLGLNQLGFQGQALQQVYGAGAQYVGQSALQSQGAGYNMALAQQSAGNQAQLMALQAQQNEAQQVRQMQYQDYMQSKYGYY